MTMSSQTIAVPKPEKTGLITIGVAFAMLTFLTSGIAAAVVVKEISAPTSDTTLAYHIDRSGVR
jgi:hypothetical protein